MFKSSKTFSCITFLSLLLACLVFISCNNDDEGTSSDKTFSDIDVVTGMNLFDANGQAIGQWRDPNINPGNVAIYPIPSLADVSLQASENIINVWLIKAECISGQAENIETNSLQLTFSKASIQDEAERTFTVPSFQGVLTLDFFDLPKGFYRLFYEMENGDVFWQNTYIDPTLDNIPDFTLLDTECGQ